MFGVEKPPAGRRKSSLTVDVASSQQPPPASPAAAHGRRANGTSPYGSNGKDIGGSGGGERTSDRFSNQKDRASPSGPMSLRSPLPGGGVPRTPDARANITSASGSTRISGAGGGGGGGAASSTAAASGGGGGGGLLPTPSGINRQSSGSDRGSGGGISGLFGGIMRQASGRNSILSSSTGNLLHPPPSRGSLASSAGSGGGVGVSGGRSSAGGYGTRSALGALTSSTPSALASPGVSAALGMMKSGSRSSPRTPGPTGQDKEATLGDIVATYGSSSIQGMRDYQEDTVSFLSQQASGCFLGGVFDGHGGDSVSKELERSLLPAVMRGISAAIARGEGEYGAGPSQQAIATAMSTAFVQTNQDISRLSSSSETGSCAVICAIAKAAGQMQLFVANAGDCRAVLYSGAAGQRRAIRLSEDHKPHPQVNPGEIARVTNAGGCVLWGRVQGCLAVSRAFGDKSLQPYVIAEPYISVRVLNPDQDMFLYMVSDGVTDVIEDAAGCQIVAEQFSKGASAFQAAAALVAAAYQQGSMDNISAVVIRLSRRR